MNSTSKRSDDWSVSSRTRFLGFLTKFEACIIQGKLRDHLGLRVDGEGKTNTKKVEAEAVKEKEINQEEILCIIGEETKMMN